MRVNSNMHENIENCFEIMNEPNCVILKVKPHKRIDLIKTGLFNGNETMFRVTKGDTQKCTTWYDNGNVFEWHHGGSSYTCVADSVWDTWTALERMISEMGINLKKLAV